MIFPSDYSEVFSDKISKKSVNLLIELLHILHGFTLE